MYMYMCTCRWGNYAGVRSEVNSYIVNYVIYVCAAVTFAGLAGLFVTTLAPYAAGSGIPEVGGREGEREKGRGGLRAIQIMREW